jgi:hypothetical protein
LGFQAATARRCAPLVSRHLGFDWLAGKKRPKSALPALGSFAALRALGAGTPPNDAPFRIKHRHRALRRDLDDQTLPSSIEELKFAGHANCQQRFMYIIRSGRDAAMSSPLVSVHVGFVQRATGNVAFNSRA